ncbi:MAG: hypothetical protein OXC98_02865 [bacterium]|nr:hypothetical protein [Acidimicrobiia bacterium]MCY4649296.1 hypothetical protein [bacterium]
MLQDNTTPRRPGNTQVHLDFHTSEHVGEVGRSFDGAKFARRLRESHVDHVNLFSKCHHGWSYYPTDVGATHPRLDFDLFGDEIKACRELGLVTGAYYTVGWSARDLDEHPEWAATDRGGVLQAINVDHDAQPTDRRPPNSWVYLCPTGAYLSLMAAQVREIAERYSPDGFFFDICGGVPCYCARCRVGMAADGIHLDDIGAVEEYNLRRWERALQQLGHAAQVGSGARWIFFNGTTVLHGDAGHVPASTSGLWSANTHQELEHLPTTWGGYDKLALRSRYFHGLGWDLVAMSGKFHTSWGEFGGYKSPRALEYEARLMIANGARCSFGDQLHPNGRLDDQTYGLLGSVYRSVRGLTEFIDGARPDSRLALCLSESEDDDQGASRALLEAHREFVVAAPRMLDTQLHTAVVVAGPLPSGARDELVRYSAEGGRILALGDAVGGWPEDVAAEVFGIRDIRVVPADGDYSSFVGGEFNELGSGLVYNYEPGLRYELVPGATALARIHDALFDRTYGQYCSHRNAPPRDEESGFAAVHRFGRHFVTAHGLGRLYLRHGAEIHRSLLCKLFSSIEPRPVIEVSHLPPGGRVTVMYQPQRQRTLLHALYAPPASRGSAVIIDDVVPITGVTARLRLDRQVKAASDGRNGQPIPLVHHGGHSVSVAMGVIDMHTVVVLHH